MSSSFRPKLFLHPITELWNSVLEEIMDSRSVKELKGAGKFKVDRSIGGS